MCPTPPPPAGWRPGWGTVSRSHSAWDGFAVEGYCHGLGPHRDSPSPGVTPSSLSKLHNQARSDTGQTDSRNRGDTQTMRNARDTSKPSKQRARYGVTHTTHRRSDSQPSHSDSTDRPLTVPPGSLAGRGQPGRKKVRSPESQESSLLWQAGELPAKRDG